MTSRPYRSAVRQDAQAETMRRIVTATVALHAEKGPLTTTHAEIAERAGVSIPTVYKHFPTRADLLPHCMAEARRGAPGIDDAAILAEPDAARRIARLVEALCALHEYFAPWLRWSYADSAQLPELAAALKAREAERGALIRAAIAPAFHGRPPRAQLALCRTLLDFPAWHRLLQELGDPASVRRAITVALQLIVIQHKERKQS